jgi:hypothetical protein
MVTSQHGLVETMAEAGDEPAKEEGRNKVACG